MDMATAQSQNLSFASDDTFIMRADSTTVLSASGPGRNSVRIKSNKTYTTHVVIFDIRHMPQGCATWPAAWEVDEATWPNGGETDVVEGVNDHGPNQSTLHTSPGTANIKLRSATCSLLIGNGRLHYVRSNSDRHNGWHRLQHCRQRKCWMWCSDTWL